MRLSVALAAAAWLSVPGVIRSTAAVPRILLVHVRDAASGRPIANADVATDYGGTHRLSDERGDARVSIADTGVTVLRARQIGYAPAERRVVASAGSTDTITIAMTRNSVILPASVARAPSSCALAGDSSSRDLSLLALDQLRLAAEHYDDFKRAYPFRVFTHTRSVPVPRGGRRLKIQEHDALVNADDWGDRYEPGGILHRGFGNFSVSILFLATLSDSAFWNRHCLVAKRIETLRGRRVVPLEFTPAPWHAEPDWAGIAWLDSATSALHRLDFHLANLGEDSQPRRLEGYMTFSSPAPYIALPDSIVAGWWKQAPTEAGDWGLPNVVQLVHVTKVEYLKGAP